MSAGTGFILKAKRGSKNHLGQEEVVRCLNPACGAWPEPGLKFCDSCLTGMLCFGKLKISDMGLVRREEVPWDRT